MEAGTENTPRPRRGAIAALVIAVSVVAALLIVRDEGRASTTSSEPTARVIGTAGSNGATIDGIPCNTSEQLTYHEHAHLQILYRGHPAIVPAYIGITNSCFYWLHTHDESGIIHMEAPGKRRVTLGQFFDIARFPLSRNRVGDLRVAHGLAMRVWVNLRVYRGNPRDIVLQPYESITIEIRPPFSRPTLYHWPPGY